MLALRSIRASECNSTRRCCWSRASVGKGRCDAREGSSRHLFCGGGGGGEEEGRLGRICETRNAVRQLFELCAGSARFGTDQPGVGQACETHDQRDIARAILSFSRPLHTLRPLNTSSHNRQRPWQEIQWYLSPARPSASPSNWYFPQTEVAELLSLEDSVSQPPRSCSPISMPMSSPCRAQRLLSCSSYERLTASRS